MRKNPPKKFKKTKHKIAQDSGASVTPTQKAILDTLKYRQIFDCPMLYHQIWSYLISSKPVSEKDFKTSLNDLVEDKKVLCKDAWYSLNKVDYERVEKRKKHAEKLIVQANGVVKYLKHLPWLEMMAVTGSVAAFNADEQSDIDLLIVTKPQRLFLSRLFVVLILKLLGVYWYSQKPAGTICPNILLTSDNLAWDEKNRNIYVANEISLLYPLFSHHNCYFDFLKHNAWVTHYLTNLHIPDYKSQPPAKSNFLGKLTDLIELAVMKIQMLYMKNKKTTEIVSKNLVHFNTHDSASVILNKFEMR